MQKILALSLCAVLWTSTALANCGTPECTAKSVPEMPNAVAAWNDLEKTMEAQRKLAKWHDDQPDAKLDYSRALENNHISFETHLVAVCGELDMDKQETCYVEKIRNRIADLQNPDGDNYIWLP